MAMWVTFRFLSIHQVVFLLPPSPSLPGSPTVLVLQNKQSSLLQGETHDTACYWEWLLALPQTATFSTFVSQSRWLTLFVIKLSFVTANLLLRNIFQIKIFSLFRSRNDYLVCEFFSGREMKFLVFHFIRGVKIRDLASLSFTRFVFVYSSNEILVRFSLIFLFLPSFLPV